MTDAPRTIRINRAPVLALWAAVVAQRLGHDRDAALTLGHALAGLNAHSKSVRLGLYAPTPADVSEVRHKARTATKGVTEALAELTDGELHALIDATNGVPQIAPGLLMRRE
jgi:hypothetical protein